jgi:ATP-dependent Clp protease ATP-binding subunit ClpC
LPAISVFVSSLPYGIPTKIYGLFFTVTSFWLMTLSLRTFYNSYYFRDKAAKGIPFVDYDLALSVSETSPLDPTAGFFRTSLGKTIMFRAGIPPTSLAQFFGTRGEILSTFNLSLQSGSESLTVHVEDIALACLQSDDNLRSFLFENGIQKKELAAVSDWIEESVDAEKAASRWWSGESLSRISGLGRDWSYGQIWRLEKYQKPIYLPKGARYEIHSSYGVDELKQLENVLSRKREANVLLVGNDEAGKINIIAHLFSLIDEDKTVSALRHKRPVVFDSDAFISAHGQKTDFEQNFEAILIEAEKAGNVILVIENFPSFSASAAALGSDLPSIMSSFLASSRLQMIALSDNERFHQMLEPNAILMQHFERIFVKDIDETNTVKVLENEVEDLERSGLFFTYPALVAVAESAERYFSDGVMPDKAVDLLLEVAPKLEAAGKNLVEKTDVLSLVEEKTGIPTGQINESEKEKLLNLEKILHDRVIGQDMAISAIANAVRRARSGIESPDRPMGSFLFLGPTGVGKTETTKALAQIFFGDDSHIVRLDMSEYASGDSVSKLIGSFEGRQQGVLSTLLREHPYGVLLLDEFEKTTKEVMNLFLQILDEGFFSDMSGHKVNARNLIIIATSNAGSDMIWNSVKEGRNLSDEKSKIIDTIIGNGIFKPELLNRFDGVILFNPLSDDDLRKIAGLMLKKLQKRLAEKGIDLVINDALISFLVSKGADPKFGARPLNRAIEDTIEQIISKKIIAGSLGAGSKVSLTTGDLA